MSGDKQFFRQKWTRYLGELRPIHDIHIYWIPPSPSPSPTPTLTPGICYEYTAYKISTFLSQSQIDWTDCNGIPQSQILESPPSSYPEQITFCGKEGTLSYDNAQISVVNNGTCIPVSPSSTPTLTPTPSVTNTNTPTPSITPTLTPNFCREYTLVNNGFGQTTFNWTNCDGSPGTINLVCCVPTTICAINGTVTQSGQPGTITAGGLCSITPTPSVTPTQTLTPTQSPTQTMTPSPSITPYAGCDDELTMSNFTSTYSGFNGTYYFYQIGYYNPIANSYNTGPAPNGNSYIIYKKSGENNYVFAQYNPNTLVVTWIMGVGWNPSVGGVLLQQNTITDGLFYYPRSGPSYPSFGGYISYPIICPTNTPTPSITPSATCTLTPTPSITASNTATPTLTPTQTLTPTCGTFTTQYMEVILQSCHNFSLKLFDNPNLTGNANAVCDVVISGCAYGDQGTIYCGTETITSGNHTHNFSLQPVLQPGECVTAFTVNSITEQCPCYDVIYVPNITPTPSPTNTQTPSPSVTQTMTQTPSPSITNSPSITASQTQTPSNTPTQTMTETPTNTPSITPTNTETPTQTPSETSEPVVTNFPTNTPTSTQTQTPSETPTNTPSAAILCYTWTNNSGVSAYYDYTDCNGTQEFNKEILNGNSICAQDGTVNYISGGVLSGGVSQC